MPLSVHPLHCHRKNSHRRHLDQQPSLQQDEPSPPPAAAEQIHHQPLHWLLWNIGQIVLIQYLAAVSVPGRLGNSMSIAAWHYSKWGGIRLRNNRKLTSMSTSDSAPDSINCLYSFFPSTFISGLWLWTRLPFSNTFAKSSTQAWSNWTIATQPSRISLLSALSATIRHYTLLRKSIRRTLDFLFLRWLPSKP